MDQEPFSSFMNVNAKENNSIIKKSEAENDNNLQTDGVLNCFSQ